VREKYCFSWKFTIVYDKPQPNEHVSTEYKLAAHPFLGLF